MQMTTKVDLIKRLDEHECVLTWSSSAPGAFILASIEDFKAFIVMKLKEQEDKKASQSEVVQETPKEA